MMIFLDNIITDYAYLRSSTNSLIKMVYSFSSKSGHSPTPLEIEHSGKRNFGGLLGADDPMREFEEHLQMTALAEVSEYLPFEHVKKTFGKECLR